MFFVSVRAWIFALSLVFFLWFYSIPLAWASPRLVRAVSIAPPSLRIASVPSTERDTDHDGLSDRLEASFGTDPLNADTDGDHFLDGVEILNAFSPTSTDRLGLAKSIKISIATQELSQQVMGIPIKSHKVSTGLPRLPTPIGTFHVLQKIPRAWSRAGRLWMPYWMHFSGRGHGIHELPEWPNGRKEGQSHLGRKASHGCVRLGIGDAKEVYEWTPIGTPVIIVAH